MVTAGERTARVIVATAYGPPDVLAVVEQPVEEPGPGHVLVEVRAAGVNPWDVKAYSGAFAADPSKLPMRLGLEAAGVVVAVGEEAVGPAGPIQVRDEVVASGLSGAYADLLLVPAANAVPRPKTLTWTEAAGLLVTGSTAVHMLTATSVGEGDTVLVHGASGGVGAMAVQLSVARGARVIGTCSESRHEELRALGAEPVVYGDGLVHRVQALAPNGVDVALDTVGTEEAVDASLELVRNRKRIVTIVGSKPAAAEGIRLLGNAPGAEAGTEIRAASRLELSRVAAAGGLAVKVAAAFPFEQAADAHRLVATGHAGGKVVLVP